MKKFFLFVSVLLVLASCAGLPNAYQLAWTKLREAVNSGRISTMNGVFAETDKGVIQEIIDNKDKKGNTLLILATSSDSAAMVEAILKNGADPNIAGKNGQTALHIAVADQYKGVVVVLLRYNANRNLKDAKGKTPLDYATAAKNTELVNILKASSSGGNADTQKDFLAAIEQNNTDAFRRLLESGKVDMYQDVPASGSRRAMPILLWAIDTNRSFSIIREIVDYYTEPLDRIVDRDGRNAWYYATLRNNKQVQTLLRQKGITMTNAENTQW